MALLAAPVPRSHRTPNGRALLPSPAGRCRPDARPVGRRSVEPAETVPADSLGQAARGVPSGWRWLQDPCPRGPARRTVARPRNHGLRHFLTPPTWDRPGPPTVTHRPRWPATGVDAQDFGRGFDHV